MAFLPRYSWCSACYKARANDLADLQGSEHENMKTQNSTLILQINTPILFPTLFESKGKTYDSHVIESSNNADQKIKAISPQ